MSVQYRPGHYCDVAVWIDGRLIQVTADGPLVRCFLEDDVVWQQAASESLLFCRGAVQGNLMLTVHQGQSGTAHLIGNGLTRSLGPTFGVQPVAIDGTYAYVVRSAQSYDRIRLSDGQSESFAHGVPGSSQGISDVIDGVIWWADTHRSMTVAGVTLTYPNRRGSVIVGQADPPQCGGVYGADPFTAFLVPSYEPHVAQSGDRFAICARTPNGAGYLEGPPFPPFVSANEPEPKPKPVPHPEPVTMPVAPNRLDVVHAVIAAHPEIARTVDGPFAPARGGITQLVAQQLGAPWGRKSKDRSATNLSDDALCYRLPDGRFEIYDILAGNEAGDALWDYKGTFADGENGFFISVSAAPGAGPGPGPVPVPVGGAGATLDGEIGALQAQLAALAARVQTLEARPAPQPQTQPAFPTRVALKSSRGRYLRDDWGTDTGKFDRTSAEDGETYTLEPK